jgi:CPA1 family monovalent cation:H+ antiporter
LRLFERYLGPRIQQPSWRNVLIVAWTGMRGGVSLAAALALPLTPVSGGPFPQRDLVIFLTFCVILATLVGQGLSLAPLIRVLRLQEDGSREQEHAQAHLAAVHAALERLDELCMQPWVPDEYLTHLRAVYEQKTEDYTRRLNESGETGERDGGRQEAKLRLRQEVLTAERAAVIRLRDQGRIDDEVLRQVERELDLEEQQIQADL